VNQKACEAPPHVLFPQLLVIVQRYVAEHIDPLPPTGRVDAFLAPYYGWIVKSPSGDFMRQYRAF
jgi:type III restriction enzyme